MNNLIRKIFIFSIIGGLFVFFHVFLQDYYTRRWLMSESASVNYSEFDLIGVENYNGSKPLKYILQWTRPDTVPFIYMGRGRHGFIDRKCAFTNCVVTNKRDLLNDITDYDVIIFHGPELVYVPIQNKDFPKKRSPRQKYVYASIESSDNYPMCSNRVDGFFNWTWTYKLDSDARWGYLQIKNKEDVVIGPSESMHWMTLEDMEPVSDVFKEKIKSKSKAAAWFVSNCQDRSGRLKLANQLKEELQKYDLDLDIYGNCGTLTCDRERESDCDVMIANTYYFYLAFENSFSKDYVTEKLLRALQNDVVPVVFGGANYTRYMPDGIYLNARELGPGLLAARMNDLIQKPEDYTQLFKWKNHYSYHSRDEEPENNDYCQFCAMVNDDKLMETETIVQRFREWWDPPNRC